MRGYLLFSSIAFIIESSLLYSALLWESHHLSPPVELGQKEVVGVFKFQNTGDSPITIRGIRSDCTCTVAALEQTVYAAGDSGELKVTFTVDGRDGNQLKKIFVNTDDPVQPSTTLVLEANIPSFATVQPRLLMWRQGSESVAKEIRIKTDPTNKVSLPRRVNGIHCELIESEDDLPGEYVFRVRPLSTETKERSSFSISIASPSGVKNSYSVTVMIR